MPLLLPAWRRVLALGCLVCCLPWISAASAESAAAPASAAAAEWRDEAGFRAAARLRRGINLGNVWEAPPGTWGDRRYGAADFREIREVGFDHVRIPVAWHHYMGPAPEYRIGDGVFGEIDRMVSAARAERLAIIVNWHHFDRLTNAPDAAAIAQWHAGWAQIARHYRKVSPRELMFELLNEPRDAATTQRMNELYPGAIAALRAVDSRRTLLVSPGNWGALREVPRMSLPRELTNLVVTAHCYEPFLFTHQGASWTGASTLTRGIVFPGPPARPVAVATGAPEWVPRWVTEHNTRPAEGNPSGPSAFAPLVAAAAEWGRREGRAVHVGEFGAIVHADPESRANYARAMRTELDRHGLGWAWWDWKAAFAAAKETPEGVRMKPALREALLPSASGAGPGAGAGMGGSRGPRRR